MTKHQKGLLLASLPFVFVTLIIINGLIWGTPGVLLTFAIPIALAMLSFFSFVIYSEYME